MTDPNKRPCSRTLYSAHRSMTPIDLKTSAEARTTRPAEQEKLPERTGSWELVRWAGAGSLAEIYQARPVGAPAGQPAYALKRLRPEWQDKPEAVALFRREALVGRQVSHPHLVPILAASTARPPYYLVMPWLAGRNLGRSAGGIRRVSIFRRSSGSPGRWARPWRPSGRPGGCTATQAGQHPPLPGRARDPAGPRLCPASTGDRFGGRPLRARHGRLPGPGDHRFGPAMRHPQRHLQPGRGALRDARRPPSLHRADVGRSWPPNIGKTALPSYVASSRTFPPASFAWSVRCSAKSPCGVRKPRGN